MVGSEILPPVGSHHAASVLLSVGWHTRVQSFGVCSWIFVSFGLEWVVNFVWLGTSGNFEGLCRVVPVLHFPKFAPDYFSSCLTY